MYKSKIPFYITQNKLVVFFKMCFYKFYKNKDLNKKETKIKKFSRMKVYIFAINLLYELKLKLFIL
jgi:hypothetical protein